MMEQLKFGTSGLRGLVTSLENGPAGGWALAFLLALRERGYAETRVLLGRDLRQSSPALLLDCAAALASEGFEPVDCGALPTPALALASLERGLAAVMVTGSHIPEDRNGLKFYSPDGEITKTDEDAIADAHRRLRAPAGPFRAVEPLPDASALRRYRERYSTAFAPDLLRGLRIALYQQSSVARDLLSGLLEGFGAAVTPLERADRFIPVDTEAHREEDVELVRRWGASGLYDAVVSTDGDADRPLVADETGSILRGDLVGLLAARFVGAATIVTPVTSGSAVETSGIARRVVRTRVGSPFVIEGIEAALRDGGGPVVGFEANGGVLLGSAVEGGRGPVTALPTRDAVLPILAVLASAVRAGESVSSLVAELQPGYMAVHRLRGVAAERSAPFIARLEDDADFRDRFMAEAGSVRSVDAVDGLRMVLEDGSVVHYRASGNAPELRCYVEAASPERATALLQWGLTAADREVAGR